MKQKIKDKLAEVPYWFSIRSHVSNLTWPLSAVDSARVRVQWPLTYEWPGGAWLVETVRYGLQHLGVVRMAELPQAFEGVIFLRCLIDGNEFRVALDYSDYPETLNQAALGECDLYLKWQYRLGGYAEPKVRPGGYVVTQDKYYQFYERMRRIGNAAPNTDIAARFGVRWSGELRQKAVQLLTAADDISLVSNTGIVTYSRFLKEVGYARLGLQLPGQGPLSPRIAEFLGLGTCMISVPLGAELHVPLVPGTHFVEISHDLSDLVEKVRFYLAHDEDRLRIASAGRDYFDRYLHCEQLAGYYVHSMLEAYACRQSR